MLQLREIMQDNEILLKHGMFFSYSNGIELVTIACGKRVALVGAISNTVSNLTKSNRTFVKGLLEDWLVQHTVKINKWVVTKDKVTTLESKLENHVKSSGLFISSGRHIRLEEEDLVWLTSSNTIRTYPNTDYSLSTMTELIEEFKLKRITIARAFDLMDDLSRAKDDFYVISNGMNTCSN
jgi:hypothetical protein